MERGKLTALVLCAEGEWGLSGSYGRALTEAGVEVHYWDMARALARSARFGKVGQHVAQYIPIESWTTKANRELIVEAMDRSPDVLLFCGVPVKAGALAQIKVACPNTHIVQIWQDTLLNLNDRMIECMRVADLVACYSDRTVEQLRRLGSAKTIWAPFAMDCTLFPDVPVSDADRRHHACDVSFVGNHRPERERAVLALLDAGISVKVWAATTWPRLAREKHRVAEYFQGAPLIGRDMIKAMRSSTLALNVIDSMNYPAANMRVFETYACQGTPLTSRCPEVEPLFPDGEAAFYFEEGALVGLTKELLRDPDRVAAVGRAGRTKALAGHQYVHRVRSILASLGLGAA